MEIVILCGIVLVIALQLMLMLKKGQDNSKDFENILNNIHHLLTRKLETTLCSIVYN